jgi:hypothetical protein
VLCSTFQKKTAKFNFLKSGTSAWYKSRNKNPSPKSFDIGVQRLEGGQIRKKCQKWQISFGAVGWSKLTLMKIRANQLIMQVILELRVPEEIK